MTWQAENAQAALSILRQWDWEFCDPDGWPSYRPMELSLVVNRLAMEGLQRPIDAVFSLLSDGQLSASGTYFWRKFEDGQLYSLHGYHAEIVASRWKTLVELIRLQRLEYKLTGSALKECELTMLDLGNCSPYDLNVNKNQFSIAVAEREIPTVGEGYFEEWYSARDITILLVKDTAALEEFVDANDSLAGDEPLIGKGGGRPRTWDWDGALLYLAALAHHGQNGLFRPDGSDPNQTNIAAHLRDWFIATAKNSPEDSQLRRYGKRFQTELNALKMRDANNLGQP